PNILNLLTNMRFQNCSNRLSVNIRRPLRIHQLSESHYSLQIQKLNEAGADYPINLTERSQTTYICSEFTPFETLLRIDKCGTLKIDKGGICKEVEACGNKECKIPSYSTCL